MTGLLLVVLGAALVGRVAPRLGQPPVVGVMLLGLLGPLALGSWAPGVAAWLWPPAGAPLRATLADVGTVALVALLGLHLDAGGTVRRRSAVTVTVLGGLAAVAAAVVLTVLRVLLGHDLDIGTSVAVTACALGTTALPVLGELVRSRGLTGAPEVRLALASAALLDGAVWLVLGLVIVSDTWSSAGAGVGALVALVVGGLLVARYARSGLRRVRPGAAGAVTVLVALVVGTAVFAALGRAAGVHAVVGAFVLGAAVPWDALPGSVRRALEGPVQRVVTHVLLPVCFLVSGLSAEPVVASVQAVALVVAVVALAVACKVLGVGMAVRAGAVPREQAARLAALLNTRGVTEVLVIGAAREAGVLDPATATAFLVAAVVTTTATGPWLTRIEQKEVRNPHPTPLDASP